MEEWRKIAGFDDYVISSYGRVKSITRKVRYVHCVTKEEHFRTVEEQYRALSFNKRTGYNYVILYIEGKSFSKVVHRLVAQAFIPNPLNLPQVNHINGNKIDNEVSNLEWVNESYNHAHAVISGLSPSGERHPNSLLNDKSVIAIKNLLKMKLTHSLIADIFEVSRSLITQISVGNIWSAVEPTNTKELILDTNHTGFSSKKVNLINKHGETIKTWDSVRMAAKELKIDSSIIGKVANGKRKSYRGMTFVFAPNTVPEQLQVT